MQFLLLTYLLKSKRFEGKWRSVKEKNLKCLSFFSNRRLHFFTNDVTEEENAIFEGDSV